VATRDLAAHACVWLEAPRAAVWSRPPAAGVEREQRAEWAAAFAPAEWLRAPKVVCGEVALARALLVDAAWLHRHRRTDWAGACGYAKAPTTCRSTAWAAPLAAEHGWTPEAVLGLAEAVAACMYFAPLWGGDDSSGLEAFYHVASFINTACDCSAMRIFSAGTMAIITARPIAAGEEITVNYNLGDETCTCPVDHRARTDRRTLDLGRCIAYFPPPMSRVLARYAADYPHSPLYTPLDVDNESTAVVRDLQRLNLTLLPRLCIGVRELESTHPFQMALLFFAPCARALQFACQVDFPTEHRPDLIKSLVDLAAAALDVLDRGESMPSARALVGLPLLGALATCFHNCNPTDAPELAALAERAAALAWRTVPGAPDGFDPFYSILGAADFGARLHAFLHARRPVD
jgi:hypothetical protein